MEKKFNNSTNRIIIGAVIIVMSLIIIGISGSYAYFVSGVEKVAGTDESFTLTSGDLIMNFATTNYFEGSNLSLISNSNYVTEGVHTDFSISLLNEANNTPLASYEIYLTDIVVSKNLDSKYLHWALHDSTKSIASGTFAGITTGITASSDTYYHIAKKSLLTNININKGDTKQYKLYVWLENDPNNIQNSLLDGKLEFRVGFRAIQK